MAHENPFDGLDQAGIYELLTSAGTGLPHWPSENLQKHYTGASGPFIVRRGLDFVDVLADDGAFREGWKGLDYGCGWGRLASLLLSKGGPEQLDLVDAWPVSLQHLQQGGFRNAHWLVSELLEPDQIPSSTYDFIIAFSVFTHFSSEAFWHNLAELTKGLKVGGRLYFTVRHDDFVSAQFPDEAAAVREILARDGFFFRGTPGDLGQAQIFGNAIVSPELLARRAAEHGALAYLGRLPNQYQHVYALSRGER